MSEAEKWRQVSQEMARAAERKPELTQPLKGATPAGQGTPGQGPSLRDSVTTLAGMALAKGAEMLVRRLLSR